jgi:hypothetical protein
VEKSSPKLWTTSVIFKKAAQRKQSPKSRNFAQSGHPGARVCGVHRTARACTKNQTDLVADGLTKWATNTTFDLKKEV